jgi:hypothetical protein
MKSSVPIGLSSSWCSSHNKITVTWLCTYSVCYFRSIIETTLIQWFNIWRLFHLCTRNLIEIKNILFVRVMQWY